MNAAQAIEYIHSVCWKGSIPGLGRTQTLLEKMGNPEKKLKFVHIAGTNGNFGLEEGEYVGLPTAEDSWNFTTFTVEDYNAVVEQIRSGAITVDNTSDDATKPTTSDKITVDYQS